MAGNQEKFERLRKQFPVFVYRNHQYSRDTAGVHIKFSFALEDASGKDVHEFFPELNIPFRTFYRPENLAPQTLDRLVFHCGMVELISYWKAACSPTVRVNAGFLDAEQKAWFKKLYYKGLGEFFYLNGIETSLDSFMEIQCSDNGNSTAGDAMNVGLHNGILVPVGGGKDSVVSLEILKTLADGKADTPLHPMVVNMRGATRNCCIQAGFDEEDCAVVNRSIDPLLLQLNQQGFLNGHTPFSAMLAFTSLLVSGLSGCRHIALSNENSANESTVGNNTDGANHQYSKSLEFENDFRAYVRKYLDKNFNYFSFLRPLNEIGIARLFASYPLYHGIFRSCNAGSKTDSWCGACPKCLFAFIILAPFMGIKKCSRLFGKNLLDDLSLQTFLDQLCGVEEVKPFECVGTRDEVNWALQKLAPFAGENRLLEYYFSLPQSRSLQPEKLPDEFFSEHNLLPEFEAALRQRIHMVRQRQTAGGLVKNPFPETLRKKMLPFFDVKGDIAIMGLGREGESSYRLLRQLLPQKHLVLVDANPAIACNPLFAHDTEVEYITGEKYLDTFAARAASTGLILKTPGISLKDFPEMNRLPNLSSQTDIFLRAFGNQIIGITGTKGKSTTTLLTHHLLSAFKPCVLAGNIGIPFFDILDEIGEKSCIVCELSAHQLEHAHTAPHIGVLLNLYEEHLDHYRSFLDYQNAKINLAGRSEGQVADTFIYNADDVLINARLAERFPDYRQQTRFIAFSPSSEMHLPVAVPQPHPLIGRHNEANLTAALLAAHAEGIDYARLATRVASFKPLPHRLEYVGCVEGRHFFNDSISTIPQACIAAVESISALPYIIGVDCVIVGGMDRGIDYSPLVDFLARNRNVENIAFTGDAGRRIYGMLKERNALPSHSIVEDDYEILIPWAKTHTREGHACILSPAAASYDRFKNFAHRGEVFRTLVLK